MSRWSSPHKALLLLLALGLGFLPAAGAQDTAILRAGPDPARGIPYLPPNALAGFRGAYLIGPKDFQLVSRAAPQASPRQPQAAEVFYTREPLVLPQEWGPIRCANLSLLVVSGHEQYTLCYRDGQGYTLFFQFPGPPEQPEPAGACAFVESFVRRFQILLGFVDAAREPPFPAILQLPG